MPAHPLVVVRRSLIQGRGVFARLPIRKGRRILEYVGERISDAEAEARYDDRAMRRHHTFLFEVRRDVVIDGAVRGNASRLINHSCDPNCEAVLVGSRLWVYARRPIATGEELAYDYAYARDGTETAADERLYACRCGAARCRGSILKPKRGRRVSRRRR